MRGGQKLRGCYNHLVLKGVRVRVDSVEVDEVTGKVRGVFHAARGGLGSRLLAQGDLKPVLLPKGPLGGSRSILRDSRQWQAMNCWY